MASHLAHKVIFLLFRSASYPIFRLTFFANLHIAWIRFLTLTSDLVIGRDNSSPPHVHPGKIPTLNGSSDQYVANAWIMSSSSTSFISSDFFAPTFLTIIRLERILRWANNVQNKDRSSSLTWERSSPSRTSAVCIMSTAAPPETRLQRR
jgi:hypothetical protein